MVWTAMVEVWLPYGKTEVPAKIPDESYLGVIDAKEFPGAEKLPEEILGAIDNPIGSEKLEKIATPGEEVAIVADEVSSSKIILPSLIKKLTDLGVNKSEIKVIFGYNLKLEPDLKSFLIEDTVNSLNVAVSDVGSDGFIHIGGTSRGTRVLVDKVFAEADLRILIGRISFHPYAGYTGGRDGILPAICGAETIQSSGALILNSKAKTRNLDKNPLHQEMEEAAKMAKVNYIINVVFNARVDAVKVFAGDLDAAFLEGVQFVDEKLCTFTENAADIVIFSSGGHPWDTTLSEACKGLTAATSIVKRRGVIIWVAESTTGYGNDVFYDWMTRFKTASDAAKEVRKSFTLGGDAAYLLLSAQEKAQIILVSILPDYYATGIFRLRTARTVNAALNSAYRIIGKKGKVLVLPQANTVFPIIREGSR